MFSELDVAKFPCITVAQTPYQVMTTLGIKQGQFHIHKLHISMCFVVHKEEKILCLPGGIFTLQGEYTECHNSFHYQILPRANAGLLPIGAV